MRNEWIQKPQGGTAVVFVHGILSSADSAWLHKNGSSWPRLLAADPALSSVGIYTVTYQTGLFSGGYRVGDIVDALKEHLRLDGLLDCNTIVFVCHSMGGIVVRKLLVERVDDFRERDIDVGLFLVASPSLGADYATRLKLLFRLAGHAQAEILQFSQSNAWLNDLDKEFMNLKEARKLRLRGKELIEDKAIILKRLFRKQIVEPFAAFRYFGEPIKISESDHFTIAKPDGAQALQHRLLCEFICELVKERAERAASEERTQLPQARPPTAASDAMPAAAVGAAPMAMQEFAGAGAANAQDQLRLQLFALLGTHSTAQGVAQTVQATPRFEELFEALPDADEVARALFATSDRSTLAPYEIDYIGSREETSETPRVLREALIASGGRLLIAGRAGIGKTREAAELAADAYARQWKVCVARNGVDVRMGAVASLPSEILDSKLLLVIDNLHARLLAAAAESVDYAARLQEFIDSVERYLPGDVRVLCISRDEPRFLRQLQLEPTATKWRQFSVYRLPDFTRQGLERLLKWLAAHLHVSLREEDAPALVQNSDQKPETLIINVDLARRAGTALSATTWLPTEGESWREKFRSASAKHPGASSIYQALRMLASAHLKTRVEYVGAIASALSGANASQAIDALVDEGLFGLRKGLLTAFSAEQLGDEDAEAPRENEWAEQLDLVVELVEARTKQQPEWIEDLVELASALVRADRRERAVRAASLAIERGVDSARAFHIRGSARFLSGDLDGAQEDLGRAVEREPKNADILGMRSILLTLLGRKDEAAATLEEAIKLGCNKSYAFSTLALLKFQQARWSEARQNLDRAMALDGPTPILLFMRACAMQQLGEHAGAEEDFTGAIAGGGFSLEANFEQLQTLQRGMSLDQLSSLSQSNTAGSTHDLSVLFSLRGLSRLNQGKFAGAEEDFTAALDAGYGARLESVTQLYDRSTLAIVAEAKQHLEQARSSGDAGLLFLRSAARLELGKLDEADADLQQVEQHGRLPAAETLFLRAAILWKKGESALALVSCNQAIENGKSDVYVYSLRGDMHAAANDAAAAAADYTRAIELGRNDVPIYFARGRMHLLQQKLAEAEADVTRAVELGDQTGQALALRAGMRIDQDRFEEAEADAERLLSLGGNAEAGHLLRGWARLRLERLGEAEADFNRAIELGRDDGLVYRLRAGALIDQGRLEEGEADCTRAIERGDQASAYVRGIARMALGRAADAIEDFGLAISAGIDVADVYARRARAQAELAQWTEAEQDFTRAMDRGLADAEVRYRRGVCREQQHKYAEAIDDFSAAIEGGRRDAGVYLRRGRMYRFLKQYEESEHDFDWVLASDEDNVDAFEQRGETRLWRGELDEAERDFSSALDRTKGDAERAASVLRLRAMARYGLAKLEDSLADVTAALTLAPGEPLLIASRLGTLVMLGRIAEAEADLAELRARAAPLDEVVGSEALLLLARKDVEAAASRFAEARRLAGGASWHASNGLANWLLGFHRAADDDYERCIADQSEGDAAVAAMELEAWRGRYPERASTPEAEASYRALLEKLRSHVRAAARLRATRPLETQPTSASASAH